MENCWYRRKPRQLGIRPHHSTETPQHVLWSRPSHLEKMVSLIREIGFRPRCGRLLVLFSRLLVRGSLNGSFRASWCNLGLSVQHGIFLKVPSCPTLSPHDYSEGHQSKICSGTVTQDSQMERMSSPELVIR
jgi:hypothetical protein